MLLLNHLSLRTKMLLPIAMISTLGMAGVSFLSYHVIVHIGEFRAMIDEGGQRVATVSSLHGALSAVRDGVARGKRTGLMDDTTMPSLERLAGAIGTLSAGHRDNAAMTALGETVQALEALAAANATGDNTAFRAGLPAADTALARLAETTATLVDTAAEEGRTAAADLGTELAADIAKILAGLALSVVVALAVAARFSRRGILDPLDRLRRAMIRLAEGALDEGDPMTARRDEIGAMAAAVAVFRETARQRKAMEEAKAEAESEARFLSDAADEERRHHAEELEETIAALDSALSRLARGDLDCAIATGFAEAYEPIRLRFNRSVETLAAALADIGTRAQSIRGETGALQENARSLARRSADEAAAIEETASALGEVTRALGETAVRAGDVGEIVRTTRFGVERSTDVVRQSVIAIHAIKQSSDKIAGIVDLIDGIAFQTNLLALNAGVEAARAGDSGKGFAVVATEVRELAQRSAAAAKEIETLIVGSGQAVAAGVNLAEQAGSMLATVVEKIREASQSVDAIAGSAQEQSVAMAQITHAIGMLDDNITQNAGMAEESLSASRQLAEDTEALAGLLARFTGLDPHALPAEDEPVRRRA